MQNFSFILFVLLLLGCQSKATKTTPTSIAIIGQDNSHYENGKKHGAAIKGAVHEQIENWEQGISSYLSIDRDSMRNIVYEHSGFLNTIKTYTPELLEEINGIADGAQLDRDLVLFYNLGEEIFNFCKAKLESCSNIAYKGELENVLAYNQDLPDFLHGNHSPVILEHGSHFVFTMPGNIALSGVSERIAVSCNSLSMLQMNNDGLPLPFFIRKILALQTIDKIKDFINNTPLAIGQNLLMVTEEDVFNVEISANQIKWLNEQNDGFYYHTNFPIENTDFYTEQYPEPSCNRYQYLDNYISQSSINSNTDVKAALQELCAQPPIKNEETYLRFISVFVPNTKPETIFINPYSQESISLNFN